MTFCPILFGREFYLSYKKIMFVQNFSLHRPLFSATVGASIARLLWSWSMRLEKKEKKNGDISLIFFFFKQLGVLCL